MWELLVDSEVVDRVDLKTDKYEEAHTYFRLRKNLKHESFNDLFIVRKHKESKKPIGEVKWWKEESKNLDIEKS